MFYKLIPHLMGFVLICITIRGHEHEFSQNFLQFWIALKYTFHHILLMISTCDLELFRKLPMSIGNIMWKLEDHSYSSKRAILLQSWHFDIRKNSILCIKRRLVSRYTGCPIKNGTVDFQYIASRKLSIFLRHCIKYLPQKRMIPKTFNLVG